MQMCAGQCILDLVQINIDFINSHRLYLNIHTFVFSLDIHQTSYSKSLIFCMV